jgi:hypothetical protein
MQHHVENSCGWTCRHRRLLLIAAIGTRPQSVQPSMFMLATDSILIDCPRSRNGASFKLMTAAGFLRPSIHLVTLVGDPYKVAHMPLSERDPDVVVQQGRLVGRAVSQAASLPAERSVS